MGFIITYDKRSFKSRSEEGTARRGMTFDRKGWGDVGGGGKETVTPSLQQTQFVPGRTIKVYLFT